ncbi:MAG: dihydroorotase [Ruminococcaceae bacterium]|nr:dihydroorotase [Oscillospiraceae bacterium]
MNCILKNANVYTKSGFTKADVAISGKIIEKIGECNQDYPVIDATGKYIFPGFIDVHVHLREPGFSYKETVKTGTMAAARGGYTHVCSMPNLNPVPDSLENINLQHDIINKDAVIAVYPYGAITKGQLGNELADMEEISNLCIGFSDDGRGVQSEEMMLAAMKKAKDLGKMIVAHCEDNSLLEGGYIHKGEYAKEKGHRGICSESEWKPIQRDIELLKLCGAKEHICHISTKESVELIRQAKKDGISITCETGPHYLVLSDKDLEEDARFKMNPPLRSEEDRLALIEGIKDGTVDMIATDHAPHSYEEKSRGLEKSAMGITGLETAFSIMYTKLCRTGIISLEKLVELMHDNPMERFGIGTDLKEGEVANLTVFDLDNEFTVNSQEFLSMGKATPFEGTKVYGRCKITIYEGEIVWNEK